MSRRKTVVVISAIVLLAIGAAAVAWYLPVAPNRARRASDNAAAVEAVHALDSSLADYQAVFWNPRSAKTAVVSVYRVQDSNWAMDVLVEWDRASGESRVLSMQRNYAPK